MNLNQIFNDFTKEETLLRRSKFENYKSWCITHWIHNSPKILLLLREMNTEEVSSHIYISIDELSNSPFASIPILDTAPSKKVEAQIDCYLTTLNIVHSMRVISGKVTGVYISKTAELPSFTEVPR